MKQCGYCGRQIDEDVKFCPYCGRQSGQATPGQAAPAAKKNCGQCGRAMPATARFCPYCGGRVGAAEARPKQPEKPTRPGKTPRPPKKRRWIAAVAAALVVCIGVGGLWVFSDGDIAGAIRQIMGKRPRSMPRTEEVVYYSDDLYYNCASDDRIKTIDNSSVPYVEGEIIVTYRDVLTRERAMQKAESHGAKLTGFLGSTGLSQWYFDGNIPYEDLIKRKETILEDPEIAFASLNYAFDEVGCVDAFEGIDLDPYEDKNMDATNAMKIIDAQRLFERVLKQRKPDSLIDVGIIDVQFADSANPDLSVALSSEYENLTIDELREAIKNTNDTVEKAQLRHATHVAGILGAVYRNYKGINGTYPMAYDRKAGNTQLYGISYNSNQTMGLLGMLDYLIGKNVKIINYSMGITSSEEIQDEKERQDYEKFIIDGSITIANYLQTRVIRNRKDFLIVVAAGNEDEFHPFKKLDCLYGTEFSAIKKSEYPEVYDRIIVVGNCKKNGRLHYSSYGGDRMDIMAVGKGIWSTIPDGDIARMTGTSQATPFVSGTAAMAWTLAPKWSGAELKQKIIALSDQKQDGRMLNALKVVRAAADEYASEYPDISLETPASNPLPNPPPDYAMRPSDRTSAPNPKPVVPTKTSVSTDTPTKEPPKPTDPPKAKIDYAAIFRAKMDELVKQYGAMAGEPQVKTVGREYNWAPIWTSHESEGMLFGDVFDYDADGAPELLTMRNAPGQGDSNFFDLLFLEIYEVKDGACVLSDTANISAQGLSMGGWAGTGVSAFRYSLNGAPAIGVLCETDSGMDWVVATLSYGYTGEFLLMNNGVKYGSWPGASAEEGEEGGYLSACFEAVSERSALYTSANGDTFDHWKVVANSGQKFYDAQVNDMYWKYLGKIGLTPRRGGALSDRLLQEGPFLQQPVNDYIRYHSAADSLEALEGDLTMLGNITNEYFIESDIYFARDYLYEDMQEFIAVGNLATGSYDRQAQPSQPTLVPVELPPVPHFDNEPAEPTSKPEASADDSEKALRKKVLEAYRGTGDIQAFGYSDFDWDGRHEAFALIGVYNDSTWENTCELWFVSPDTCTRLEEDKGYYPYESAIVTEGGYACFTVSEGYFGSGSTLRLWTVLDGQPVPHSQREYAGQSGEISREVYLEDRDSGGDADSDDTGYGGTVKVREASLRSNVRTGPGLGYDTMGELTGSTELEFLNETSIDDRGVTWYKVRFKGHDGWVSEKYTKLTTH